jgi:hypothetical protein
VTAIDRRFAEIGGSGPATCAQDRPPNARVAKSGRYRIRPTYWVSRGVREARSEWWVRWMAVAGETRIANRSHICARPARCLVHPIRSPRGHIDSARLIVRAGSR